LSSNHTPANYFSAYIYASHFILGSVLARRVIQFWAFMPNFLAYNTPVRPLTEVLVRNNCGGDHLCYGEATFIRNRERRAAYHRTTDNQSFERIHANYADEKLSRINLTLFSIYTFNIYTRSTLF